MMLFEQRPSWLKKKITDYGGYTVINEKLKSRGIKTVCQSARCPNIHECFEKRQMTFMLLGDICTRRCAFCSVKKEKVNPAPRAKALGFGERFPNIATHPSKKERGFIRHILECAGFTGGGVKPAYDESKKILELVKSLGLKYVVITSPTRDDLYDGGAVYFAKVVQRLKSEIKNVKIEVLTPDFKGNWGSFKKIVNSGADVFAHNIETVSRLYSKIRPAADYELSLRILRYAKTIRPNIITKSSIMLGLGEEYNEVIQTLRDLRKMEVDGVCIGQYLRPSQESMEVQRFAGLEEFNSLYNKAVEFGFKFAASGPWVRSSYKAGELVAGLEKMS